MCKYLFLLVIILSIQGCVETTNNERYSSFNQKQKVQEFTYFVNSDTVFIGEQGTQIHLKKGALNIDTRKVKVQLSEFYNMSDMIIEGLSTMSNDNLLETAGMIYINIKTEDGEKVYLEDTKCTFQTPRQAIIKEDKIYYNLIDANSSDENLFFQEYEEISISELREKLDVKFGTVL